MNHMLDAFLNNGPALLAGVTLLLTFGCVAVAAHRSPVHRQRLAELAIVATLIWAILAVTPLPRPLAHGFFAELSSRMRPKATVAMTVPPSESAAPIEQATPESVSAPAPAEIQFNLEPKLLEPSDEDGVVMDDKCVSDSLALNAKPPAPKPALLTIVPQIRTLERTVTIERRATADAEPTARVGAAPAEAVSPTLWARSAMFLQSNWKILLLGTYALGVVVCAAWIGLGRTLLAMIVWTSEWPETWLEDMFAELCDECDTLRVWLVVSKRYPRAMSFGIFRPTIVLPAAQCVPENAELLRHVLRHELVHVGRRDAWGTLLFNLSFLFLFFHPAFWWLRSRARLSAELVADEWAATRSSRDEYARELIAFVRATRRASFLPAGATGVLGSTTPFSRRIEMLIRRERPLVMHSSPAWRIASFTMLGGLIIAMAASLGRTAPPDDEQTETSTKAKTVTVTADADDEDEDGKPATIELKVDAKESGDKDEDDDDDKPGAIGALNISSVDRDDDDDDDAPASSEKRVEKLKRQYEKLARKSAELQKQMAELQKELAESKGEQAKKHATAGEKKHRRVIVNDGKVLRFSDSEHGPSTIILDDGKLIINGKKIDLDKMKGLEGLKDLEGLKELKGLEGLKLEGLDETIRDAVKNAMKFKMKIVEDEDDDKKGPKAAARAKAEADKKVIIRKKQLAKEKHEKSEEHSTIHLKTDDGEIELEIGPDHALKVKKLKGFGKDEAELDGLKKSLEKMGANLPKAEELKILGELEGLKELKGLSELKELGQLKELEQLKTLGNLKILMDPDGKQGFGFGLGAGSGHGDKKKIKKHHRDGDEKESSKETEKPSFKVELSPGALEAMQGHDAQMEAHRAQMEAHRAQMEAVKQQIDAQRKILEKLRRKAEELRKESKDTSPSASTPAPKKDATKERHVVVKADPVHAAVNRHTGKAIKSQILSEMAKNTALASATQAGVKPMLLLDPSTAKRLGTTDKYVLSGNAAVLGKGTDGKATQPSKHAAAESVNAPADVMRLAEMVSNAIGELEQAKSELEANVPSDLKARVTTKSRMLTAERKVRLLGKIAKSLHTLASAQAKRGNAHDQDEANAKLQILDLIISDVNAAVGKSETSVSPTNSATPAAPAATVTSVAPVATPAMPVASIAPVAAAAPTPAAAATPAAPAKPKK
jgi:beta-lactamase regulating signal transducer with metallopeptidase domain